MRVVSDRPSSGPLLTRMILTVSLGLTRRRSPTGSGHGVSMRVVL